jgi:predicted nucleic acid-binding protein
LALVDRVFLDTSVLLGGLIEIGPSVKSAQTLMNALADGLMPEAVTAWHCCLEFYSVSTRLPPQYRLDPRDSLLLIEEEIAGRMRVHDLPAGDRHEFLRQASAERVVGGRVYDAHLAAIARSAGVGVVVTENPRHFGSLSAHGIAVETAEEYVTRNNIG